MARILEKKGKNKMLLKFINNTKTNEISLAFDMQGADSDSREWDIPHYLHTKGYIDVDFKAPPFRNFEAWQKKIITGDLNKSLVLNSQVRSYVDLLKLIESLKFTYTPLKTSSNKDLFTDPYSIDSKLGR